MKASLCFALGLLAVGCAPPPAPAVASQPILQGTPDPDGDPSVVFIELNQVGFCTGSVVSPHAVLTAAHCVDPSEFGQAITSVRVYFGSVQGPLAVQDLPNWISAREWHFNPDYNNDGNLAHDNGIILFDDVLPRTPLPLIVGTLGDEHRGDTIRLVGFGIHKLGDDLSYGSRYETTAVIAGFTEQLIRYQGNAHSICSGDSGGPTFLTIDGVEHIVGIHSFGYTGCIGFANDSRVDSNLYWSARMIDTVDPGFLPAGTGAIVDMGPPDQGGSASYGDGCAMGGSGADPGALAAALALLLVFALRRRLPAR